MKSPTHCPVCKDPLLNDFRKNTDIEYLVKRCQRKPDHNFSCAIYDDDDEMHDIIFVKGERSTMFWLFINEIEILTFTHERSKRTKVPFFEPDLSNWAKTMERIDMLLTFS